MKISQNTISTARGEIKTFTLTNLSGASVSLSAVGAGITAINVPDAQGRLANVVLGYKDVADYFYDGPCAGKVPGRYANRIALGKFRLDGEAHQLRINNGPNALHGGPEGFANKIWDAEVVDDNVVFTLHSPDGDECYPGNLTAKACYSWSDDNKLTLRLSAETDKKTVVNLTNHTYFNLGGYASGSIRDHVLQIEADTYLPTDADLIPTGEIRSVAGKPFDFREPKTIGRDMDADNADLKVLSGDSVQNRQDRGAAQAIVKGFADGSIDVLTSMKCLDEGVDVPRSEEL